MRHLLSAILLIFVLSCNSTPEKTYDPDIAPPPPTPAINYQIIAQHPHDTSAYTQGLQVYNNKLFEGTGDYESSSIRISDWKSGRVEKKHIMGTDKIFGEGISVFNGKIYQLTWQSHLVYVYNVPDIEKPVKTLNWPYEGWGITNNGTQLIISDGSSNLYFVDPETFRVKNTLAVREDDRPVDRLNELEFVNGYVYANVYQAPYIVKIDPESGQVKGRINLDNLLQPNDIVVGRTDVLNGIAFDSLSGNFLVTGKRWPRLFEIKLF